MTTENNNGNVYFINTCSLVEVFRMSQGDPLDRIWENMEALFLDHRMFSHRLVYDEITTDSKRPDLLSKRITPLQACFRPMGFEQAQVVSNIIKRFPGLIDPKNEREQAQPWLIAAAILEQQQYSLFNPDKKVYVVSEEDETGPDRVPSVSRGFGLGHLNLSGLYRLNGWSLEEGQ